VTTLNPHFLKVKHIQFLEGSFDAGIFMLKLNCKQRLRRAFKRTSQRSNKVYLVPHWNAEGANHEICNPNVPKHSSSYLTYLPSDINYINWWKASHKRLLDLKKLYNKIRRFLQDINNKIEDKTLYIKNKNSCAHLTDPTLFQIGKE